ncbi:MAG: alpha/beta hydrolase family protein [Byssovorax sp.]
MLRAFLNHAGSRFDKLAAAAIFYRSPRSRARSTSEGLGPDERIAALGEIAAAYDRPEHLDPDGPFFQAPRRMTPDVVPVRAIPGGKVEDWTWESPFVPFHPEATERYLGQVENRRAAARLYLHGDRPRPTALLLHGYRAGQWAVEERAWPIEWLFEKGMDVALPVFPFHAVRGRKRGAPMAPGSDPRMTNEGFRQAVLDTRTLIHHLRERGAPAIGLMGMSLGGYTSALIATIETRLAFVVPMIPLASLAESARHTGRFTGTPEQQRLQHEGLDAVHRVVSPLSRPARLDRERILVLGAEGDQITPIGHARRLAGHFGAPLEVFAGGHILQFGRGDAFRAAGKLLGRLGMFGRHR